MWTSVSWTVGDDVKQPQGQAGDRTTHLDALRMLGTERGSKGVVGLRGTWTEALVEQQRVSRDCDCQDKEDREDRPGRRGSAASRLAQETKGATTHPRRGAPRQI